MPASAAVSVRVSPAQMGELAKACAKGNDLTSTLAVSVWLHPSTVILTLYMPSLEDAECEILNDALVETT